MLRYVKLFFFEPTRAIISFAAKDVATVFPCGRGRTVKNISFIGVLISLFFAGNAFGQTTYYSRASTNWALASTWSTVSFASATNTGTFPVAGDIVNIGGGFTVTLAANAACASVTFPASAVASTLAIGTNTLTVSGAVLMEAGTGATTRSITVGNSPGILNAGSITISGANTATFINTITVATGTINVIGDVIFNSGTQQASAVLNTTGAATVNIGGNLTCGAGNGRLTLVNTATWNIGGNYSFAGTLSNNNRMIVVLNGTANQSISGTCTFRSLTINKSSGTATALNSITLNNVGLTVTQGILDLSTFTHTGAGTLTVSANAFLRVGGTRPLPTFTTYTINASSKVEFYGGSQTLTATSFGNLTLSGTGAKTFPTGTTTVNGLLSIENGTNANTFTGSLAYGASATLQYNAGASNRTVQGAGAGTGEWPATWVNASNGVIVRGTGTITLNAAKTGFGRPLTVIGGATLALSSFALGGTTPPTSVNLECGATGSNISGSGLLTLGGNVNVTKITGTGAGALISCPVALGATRTFTVADETTTISDLTISGIISTAFGLNKDGLGRLTLSATNSYTGATNVLAGVLNIQNNQGTGTAAGGVVVSSGAALEMQGGITVGAETLQLTNDGVGSVGALRNISGSNTWGGTVTLATTAARINSDAGTLTLSASNSITATNINLTLGGAGNITISGTITTGTGALTKDGAGVATLSGTNTYTGATTINAGTLRAGIATNAFGNTSAVTLANISGAILDLNGNNNTIGSLTGGGGTGGNVTIGAATLTVGSDNTSPAAFAGIISGTALTKIGTGTLTLTGTNTYTGVTNVTEGILNIQNNQGTGTTAGGVTVASGAQLQLQGDITVGNEALNLTGEGIPADGALRNISGNNTWGGTITLSSNSRINTASGLLTINATNAITASNFNINLGGAGNNIVSGIIALGSGTLTKGGAGSLTLSGANTYTGGTTLSNGILNINHASALGASGTFTIAGGSIDNTSGADITTNDYSLSLNADFTYIGSVPRNLNLGTGAVTMSASRQITVSAGTLTIGGVINDNTQNITKAGAGALSFGSQAVTLNDVSINVGTLVSTSNTLSIAGDFTNSGTFTHNSGTVSFNKAGAQNMGTATFNNLTGTTSGSKIATGNITVNGLFTLSGTANLSMGSNTITLGGTLATMSATNSLSANASSSLIINGSGALGSAVFFDQTTPGTTNRLVGFTYNRASQTITLGNALQVTETVTPTNGTLASGGNLTLISNASGTARIATGPTNNYITGNVNVQRFIPAVARRWRFLGSTVQNATLADWKNETYVTGTGGAANGFDATGSNAASVFSYNETLPGDVNAGWTAATNITNNIEAGKGYRIFIRGDRSNAGRLNGTVTDQNEVTLDLVGEPYQGNITLPVSFTTTGLNGNDGWNLVANPYASPYDWAAFYTADSNTTSCMNIDPTIWVLDAQNGGYRTYNAKTPGGDLTNGIIPAGASFWVKAYATSPALILKEQYKVATAPVAVFKTNEGEGFNIQLYYDSITWDGLFVQYKTGSTPNYDALDIRKLTGTVTISAYGNDNVQLAYSCRPVSNTVDTIKLNVSGAAGAYKLNFSNNNMIAVADNVWLFDTYTSTVTDLKIASTYNFNIVSGIAASQGMNRFYIVVGNSSALPVKLLHFTAQKTANKQVELHWATAQELNSKHFEVERSADGKQFKTIATIAAQGNTNKLVNYETIDELPMQENYYRLKQLDVDGTVYYSAIQYVLMDELNASASVKMYPIPATDVLTIEHTQPIKQLNVYDVTGKMVQSQIGSSSIETIHVNNLQTGVYIVEMLDNEGQSIKQKFTKE